jgi:hypothetical protein
LIQNAEDAGASRIVISFSDGWSDARHPLLRVPGILIVNDGDLNSDDADAMRRFGGSGKLRDAATIGRFGLGQKALFHLCDAFLAQSIDTSEALSLLANPCAEILRDSRADEWEALKPDWRLIEDAGRRYVRRGLAIWTPLRRPDIFPAAKLRVVDKTFERAALADELVARREDLAAILAALRNLDELVVLDGEKELLHLSRTEGSKRMSGPPKGAVATAMKAKARAFNGSVSAMDGVDLRYAGVERHGHSDATEKLQADGAWPQVPVWNQEGTEMRPQKASPHGAVIIAPDRDAAVPAIRWHEAVFLPLEKGEIPPAHVGQGGTALRIILHGYFFVDSARRGRRRVEDGASKIEGLWNDALMQDLVLPLLPATLKQAIDSFIPPEEVRTTIAAIARSSFFREKRKEICAEDILVRRLSRRGAGETGWSLIPGDQADRLRPLPAVTDTSILDQLLPGLRDCARARDLTLILDPDAALTERQPRWQAEEISALFGDLPTRLFQAGGKAGVLGELMATMVGEDADLQAAATPGLIGALRRAMIEGKTLAPDADIAAALRLVDAGSVFALRINRGTRPVLRALARAQGAPAPIRGEWIESPGKPPELQAAAAASLLASLAPLIEEGDSGADAMDAALSILEALGPSLRFALQRPEFATLPLVRAQRLGGVGEALSLNDLRAAQGRLFMVTQSATQRLKAIANAAPRARAWSIPHDVATRLDALDFMPLGQRVLAGQKADDFIVLFKDEEVWSEASERISLIDAFLTGDVGRGPFRQALRVVAAGDARASRLNVDLREIEGIQGNVAEILARAFNRDGDVLLIDPKICERLNKDQKDKLDIRGLAGDELCDVLRSRAESFRQTTGQECEALLRLALPCDALKALPIHLGRDGQRYPATELRWPSGDFDLNSETLRNAPLACPAADPQLREIQRRLIEPWSAIDALAHAVKGQDLARSAPVILGIIMDIEEPLPPDLLNPLKTEPWLSDCEGSLWSPCNLLDLPAGVQAALKKIRGAKSLRPGSVSASDLRPEFGAVVDVLRRLGIAPDRQCSLSLLPDLIKDLAVPAWLFSGTMVPLSELRALAFEARASDLLGWPLLVALLTEDDISDDVLMASARAFCEPDAYEAAQYLNMLRTMSNDLKSETRKLCEEALATLWDWPQVRRAQALKKAFVPTEDGVWAPAAEVTVDAKGVHGRHLLAEQLRGRIGVKLDAERALAPSPYETGEGSLSEISVERCETSLIELLAAFENQAPPPLLSLLAALCSRSHRVDDRARKLHRSTTLRACLRRWIPTALAL